MKKKIAPIVLLSLLFAQSPSKGLVGGPFDNNTIPGGGADGTYSAVLTGKNLTGLATFGIGSYSGFEGNGRFAVFHEGAVHYGVVTGTADLASKRVAAALLGVAGLPGETAGPSATSSTAGQTLTIRSSAEGAFSAFMNGLPQQILFEGDGTLSTTANSVVTIPGVTSNSPITITIPAAPNTNSDTTTQTDTPTDTVTTTPTTSDAFVRSETPFKVRGSRTSTTSYSALNSFAALAPITVLPSATATTTPGG